MGIMIRNIAAELLIMRKRAGYWVLLAVWIALAVFFAYILPYATGDDGGRPVQIADLLPERLTGTLIGGYPFFGGAIALILAVMTIGGEFGWGTWKTLFTQRPGRLQVFGAKLAALGLALIPFVVLVFIAGAVASAIIARMEGEAIAWPSASLFLRATLAGWLILAVWAALGVLFAVLTRGVALAMGIGILYALVIEGLLNAFAGEVSLLDPLVEFFLRANTYSLAAVVGASAEAAADNGPGAFSGPFVSGAQAIAVLAAYTAAFLGLSALLLRRRDVA
jgi:ABC-type transport system involved in multi-copper enzyme maturation permease subunit